MNKKHSDNSLSSVTQSVVSDNIETPCDTELPQQKKKDAAIRLLKLWREGDESEQKETWEYLKGCLNV